MARTLIRARPRVPRPPQLQGVTGDYGSALYNIVNGVVSDDVRLPVTERTVSGLVGCWAAVAKISSATAQMLVAADAMGPDGRTPMATVPTVLSDPCSGYDSYVYWREALSTALMHGNFVGVKTDYDPVTGYPRQILPVHPSTVAARWTPEGYPLYTIGGVECGADDVVHVKLGLSIPGQIMAIGVVEAHRRNLSAQLDLQGMTSGVWQQGAVPSGVVTIEAQSPTQDQVAAVKAGWIGALGGRRTVAVIGKNMSYAPVTWNAVDAQWLQSRQFTIAECALMWGLRPEDLGSSFGASSGAMTYGNRTDDAIQRITDSYVPAMLPFEQAWSRLIPGKNFVKGNVESLLRSTTRERYELHVLAQQAGIETVDESRELEGKPKLPPSEEERPLVPVKQMPNVPNVDPKQTIKPEPLQPATTEEATA